MFGNHCHASVGLFFVCAVVAGCGSDQASNNGWNIVFFGLRDGWNSEQARTATRQVSEIPRQLPGVERYEWGEMIEKSLPQYSHVLLMEVDNPEDSAKVLTRQLSGSFPNGFEARPMVFANLRDATTGGGGSARGQLRRLLHFNIQGDVSDKAEKLAATLMELPSKISAIERLQWGIDPYRGRGIGGKEAEGWGVLFTFEDATARDACVSDPAYKEFERLVLGGRRGSPSVIEYIADDDWSF